MALTDEGNGGIPATMLVAPTGATGAPYPVYMGGGSQGGNSGGWDNGNGWWIILLFILLASGNWGGNGNGNGGGGMFSGAPIVVNDGGGSVQRGFDQAATMSGINGIQNGIYGLSTQLCNCCGDIQSSLCNGFAGVNATVNSVAANAETAANARQMANMNQIFGLSQQFADCCCENRLATCQTQNIIQSEASATRFADANNTRDIVDSQTRGTQVILDKLCSLELDNYRRENDQLRTQLNMANLAASQVRQTADIQNNIISELRACPIPAQPVYGSQPIFTCQNNGCGCGSGCGCGA